MFEPRNFRSCGELSAFSNCTLLHDRSQNVRRSAGTSKSTKDTQYGSNSNHKLNHRLSLFYLGGCLRCKQRKIKCDEALPHCNQCTRRALDCPGYVRPLKWSAKYETWNSTGATKENSKDLNRSERDLANNAKGPEHDLSQTSRKLGCIGSPSLSERGHVPESNDQRHTTGSVSIEDDFNLDPDKLLGPLLFSRPSIDEFFFDAISQSQALDTTTLWDDLLIPSPQIAEDQSTRLSRHYFSIICRINCCFDSSKNPFRVWVAESMHSCPPLYHCILSMSASHLVAKQQSDLLPIALEHRAKAVSKLGTEILSVDVQSSLKSYSTFEGISRALLACILLGITDVRFSLEELK